MAAVKRFRTWVGKAAANAGSGAQAARRSAYRVGQFARGLAAKIKPGELEHAASYLPPAALPLFTAMPVDAQRHSLDVLYTLTAGGPISPDLAAAALLHDCGKVASAQGGIRLGLWQRGPLVLLDHFAPAMTARWEVADPHRGWRYLLYVQHNHPAIGAHWAAAAGCSELTCWLIAHHQTPPEQLSGKMEDLALLAALEDADELN
jgi:hypothetical protein